MTQQEKHAIEKAAAEYWKQFTDKNRWDVYGDFKAGAEFGLKLRDEQLAIAVHALKFYANKTKWGEIGPDQRNWYEIESTDRGKLAREALAKIKGE